MPVPEQRDLTAFSLAALAVVLILGVPAGYVACFARLGWL